MLEHIPGLPDLILFWMNDVSVIHVSRCEITRGTLSGKHVLTLIWMIMTGDSFKIVSKVVSQWARSSPPLMSWLSLSGPCLSSSPNFFDGCWKGWHWQFGIYVGLQRTNFSSVPYLIFVSLRMDMHDAVVTTDFVVGCVDISLFFSPTSLNLMLENHQKKLICKWPWTDKRGSIQDHKTDTRRLYILWQRPYEYSSLINIQFQTIHQIISWLHR